MGRSPLARYFSVIENFLETVGEGFILNLHRKPQKASSREGFKPSPTQFPYLATSCYTVQNIALQ